jgi:hypothetical protein
MGALMAGLGAAGASLGASSAATAGTAAAGTAAAGTAAAAAPAAASAAGTAAGIGAGATAAAPAVYSTIGGAPTMSLASGGTNLLPAASTQQMAAGASAMPTATGASSFDTDTQNMIKRMNDIKNSGVMDTPEQQFSKQHPYAAAFSKFLQAHGQATSGQPIYSGNQSNESGLQQQMIQNAGTQMSPANMMNLMYMQQMQAAMKGQGQGGGNSFQGPSSLQPPDYSSMANQILQRRSQNVN